MLNNDVFSSFIYFMDLKPNLDQKQSLVKLFPNYTIKIY